MGGKSLQSNSGRMTSLYEELEATLCTLAVNYGLLQLFLCAMWPARLIFQPHLEVWCHPHYFKRESCPVCYPVSPICGLVFGLDCLSLCSWTKFQFWALLLSDAGEEIIKYIIWDLTESMMGFWSSYVMEFLLVTI